MPEEFKPKFDPTLRLDHLITMILLIGVVVIEWNPHVAAVDKRVTVIEAQQQRQAQIDAAQDQRLREELALIRQSQQRLEDKLDALLAANRPGERR